MKNDKVNFNLINYNLLNKVKCLLATNLIK